MTIVKMLTQKIFSVEDCKEHPENIYVFGDNMVGMGKGGQACIRGCDNAIGIPTKAYPTMKEEGFFVDNDLSFVYPVLLVRFKELMDLLKEGYNIVLPEDGLGTGLAELPKRAPRIYQIIEQLIATLKSQATIMAAKENGQ